jgi:hypothetical protein
MTGTVRTTIEDTAVEDAAERELEGYAHMIDIGFPQPSSAVERRG